MAINGLIVVVVRELCSVYKAKENNHEGQGKHNKVEEDDMVSMTGVGFGSAN